MKEVNPSSYSVTFGSISFLLTIDLHIGVLAH
ncbi:hypothetical protein IG3_05443 [Bacillus cereus HuA2-1]|uniref:Uncharacterized protein n=1 Tax=Bacillus cereus HuA2-1 TaxID=1053201 RepID=J9BNC3_BACCE|nr:hypothetical protein IG3_05443 [Bacillus cereus HuA2-1]